MNDIFEKQIKAEAIFKKIKSTDSMPDIADIVDSLDEEMAKLVLKKYIYSYEN